MDWPKRFGKYCWSVSFGLMVCSGVAALADDAKPPINFQFSGFIQLDAIHDSTRSLTEIPANTAIAPATTSDGANGRSQFSARASRLRVTANGPTVNSWGTQGILEIDFFGAQSGVSEGAFFGNSLPRMRHAAFFVTKPGWQLLVGQFWNVFGMPDAYLPTTVAFRPPVGVAFGRTPQVRLTHDLIDGDSFKTSLVAAIVRPTQRDSEVPNLDFAARFFLKKYQSKWAIPFRAVHLEPASITVSGTFRGIGFPSSVSSKTTSIGNGFAADFMIPILPASDVHSMSLTWTGEVAAGSGIGDLYTGFSANLPALATSKSATQPNLDAGIAGVRTDTGALELVKVFAANTTLQFHPGDWDTFFNIYYGTIHSSNASLLTPDAGKTIYSQLHSVGLNVFHDFTDQIRLGVEYMAMQTIYVSASSATNHRMQVSGWFSF